MSSNLLSVNFLQKLFQLLDKLNDRENQGKYEFSYEQKNKIIQIFQNFSFEDSQKLVREIKKEPVSTNRFHKFILSLSPLNGNNTLSKVDHLLTEAILMDLQQILTQKDQTSLKKWLSEYKDYFNRETLDSLEAYDFFTLAALEKQLPPNLSQTIQQSNRFNLYETYSSSTLEAAIDLLKKNRDYSSLSYYISSNEISIEKLRTKLSDQELIHLAPHLRYGDFQNIEDNLLNRLLEKSSKLNHLYINSQTIEFLPEMNALQTLVCRGCYALKTLSPMPALQQLECIACLALTNLPDDMPSLQKLICNACPILKALPSHIPVLEELQCRGCELLISLPNMPELQILDCSHCIALRHLPNHMPKIQKFYCKFCIALINLPNHMPVLQELDCEGCNTLRILPLVLPSMRRINCAHCPSLNKMPGIPLNTQIITENKKIKLTRLVVDLDELIKSPKETLEQLGVKFLFKNKVLPYIYYYKKGVLSIASDAGGLRRDFVSRLIEVLFQENAHSSHLRLENCSPIMDKKSGTAEAYRALGCLLALCYKKGSTFKVGPLFVEKVYERLSFFSEDSLTHPSKEKFIPLYQRYLGLSDKTALFINEPDHLTLSDQEYKILQSLLTIDDDVMNKIRNHDAEALVDLKTIYLEEARRNDGLNALYHIASGIRYILGKKGWENFCQKKPEKLQARIQGKLSKELLLKKIHWEAMPLVSSDQLDNMKQFFNHWIENATLEQIQLIVRIVSANNAFCHKQFQFKVYQRDSALIPVAHTCAFTMELPIYKTQEQFDQKFALFLSEAMAGSSFQII